MQGASGPCPSRRYPNASKGYDMCLAMLSSPAISTQISCLPTALGELADKLPCMLVECPGYKNTSQRTVSHCAGTINRGCRITQMPHRVRPAFARRTDRLLLVRAGQQCRHTAIQVQDVPWPDFPGSNWDTICPQCGMG